MRSPALKAHLSREEDYNFHVKNEVHNDCIEGKQWYSEWRLHPAASQDPKESGILDPQDPGGSIFSLSRGILGILDPVVAILSWDPGGRVSQTEHILHNPGDPGSCLGKFSWDLADIRSCTATMYRILKILYMEYNFVSDSLYIYVA